MFFQSNNTDFFALAERRDITFRMNSFEVLVLYIYFFFRHFAAVAVGCLVALGVAKSVETWSMLMLMLFCSCCLHFRTIRAQRSTGLGYFLPLICVSIDGMARRLVWHCRWSFVYFICSLEPCAPLWRAAVDDRQPNKRSGWKTIQKMQRKSSNVECQESPFCALMFDEHLTEKNTANVLHSNTYTKQMKRYFYVFVCVF